MLNTAARTNAGTDAESANRADAAERGVAAVKQTNRHEHNQMPNWQRYTHKATAQSYKYKHKANDQTPKIPKQKTSATRLTVRNERSVARHSECGPPKLGVGRVELDNMHAIVDGQRKRDVADGVAVAAADRGFAD